jgi:hypothetical protein
MNHVPTRVLIFIILIMLVALIATAVFESMIIRDVVETDWSGLMGGTE